MKTTKRRTKSRVWEKILSKYSMRDLSCKFSK